MIKKAEKEVKPSIPKNNKKSKKVSSQSTELEDYVINQKIDSTLSWFTIIAILSIINSVLLVLKVNLEFMVGLGTTQWIGAIAIAAAGKLGIIFLLIGFILNLSIAWFFYYVRKNARQNEKLLYAGLILYGLDSLLFIPLGGYIEIGFHIFVIYMISQYFKLIKIQKLAK